MGKYKLGQTLHVASIKFVMTSLIQLMFPVVRTSEHILKTDSHPHAKFCGRLQNSSAFAFNLGNFNSFSPNPAKIVYPFILVVCNFVWSLPDHKLVLPC